MISNAIDTVNKLFQAMYSAIGLVVMVLLGILVGKWSSCDAVPVPAVTQIDWRTYEEDMRKLGIVLQENGLYKEENDNLKLTIKKLTGQLKEGRASGQFIPASPMPVGTFSKREVVGKDTLTVIYKAPDLDLPISGILSPYELTLVTWNPMWEARAVAPVRKVYRFPREAENFAFSLQYNPQIYNYDGIIVQWYQPFFEWKGVWANAEYGLRGFALSAEAKARVWFLELSAGLSSIPNVYGRVGYRF